MSEAVIRKAVSDIKGGEGFGPASMAEGDRPFRLNHFHGTSTLYRYSFPKGNCNPSWFTSPVRIALPWEGPDGFQLAD